MMTVVYTFKNGNLAILDILLDLFFVSHSIINQEC